MCGIGGEFSASADADQKASALARLQTALSHRGPDGTGSLIVDCAALAQTRLAIIDIQTGQQPLWNHDRTLVIVFNGEIYNYRELRERFAANGEQFRTQSDTEVVLAAYRAEGVEGFSRLRGMYAFALWDRRLGRGYLARDPMGIKPLFIAQSNQGDICFASEAKGVLAYQDQRFDLDPSALHQLLNFRYLPGTLSLFNGIRQLEPGEVLEWDGLSPARKMQIAIPAPANASLAQTLADSVAAHLVADVPVGCYLSGGIDSGVIAALAQRANPAMTTFTLDVGDDPNEARNAAGTAQALGLPNTIGQASDIDAADIARQLWHLELPKVNAIQLFQLARLARSQVKVTLSGLGGDELFRGYTAHRILHFFHKFQSVLGRTIPRALGRAALPFMRIGAHAPNTERERAAQMAAASGDWPKVYGLLRNVWDSPPMRAWLYGPRLLDAKPPDAFASIRTLWQQHASPLASMLDFEWRQKMVNDLLWQEDRAGMAHGLEVRTPFVDSRVYAHVRQGPYPKPGKQALRHVAADLLPAHVLRRPKSGFQLDAPSFFESRLSQFADLWLDDAAVRRYALFNPQTVAMLRKLPAQRRYRWHFFMLMLMIQAHMWVEIFERGESPAALTA